MKNICSDLYTACKEIYCHAEAYEWVPGWHFSFEQDDKGNIHRVTLEFPGFGKIIMSIHDAKRMAEELLNQLSNLKKR